jgi:hypothetical protein
LILLDGDEWVSGGTLAWLIRFEIVGGGESEEEGWITEREEGTMSSVHN